MGEALGASSFSVDTSFQGAAATPGAVTRAQRLRVIAEGEATAARRGRGTAKGR